MGDFVSMNVYAMHLHNHVQSSCTIIMYLYIIIYMCGLRNIVLRISRVLLCSHFHRYSAMRHAYVHEQVYNRTVMCMTLGTVKDGKFEFFSPRLAFSDSFNFSTFRPWPVWPLRLRRPCYAICRRHMCPFPGIHAIEPFTRECRV